MNGLHRSKFQIEVVDLAELKVRINPCKHCSGGARLFRQRTPESKRTADIRHFYWVQCLICSVQTGRYCGGTHVSNIQFVVACWNRTPDKSGYSPRGEVEAGVVHSGQVPRRGTYE
jgi:hypothetical protein